eukprot:COSAG06_NODE_1693_length_8701_cov_80.626133_11_plen_72_part_00
MSPSSPRYSSTEDRAVRVRWESVRRGARRWRGQGAPPLAVVLLHHDDLIPRLQENGTVLSAFPMCVPSLSW